MSLLRRLILLVMLVVVPIVAIEITNLIQLHNERVTALNAEAERLAVLVDDGYTHMIGNRPFKAQGLVFCRGV
ncbi:hypothetical protein JL100_032660 (plasmid) [Skermanella mucosa]|uniref:hypothetical protein n=1 Tax=Skermanella mucosa TaxID=1789672 RepID=UPI001E604836|nr:hypothetical protein [Skermanella mucosa]UEM24377.1 hypothetical protein JL100_032660 [Skermanella mucosa]